LINYLNNGGNLYIESTELGKDHNGTEFFNMLGLTFLGDGGDFEIEKIIGVNDAMTSDMELNYIGGESPHYSVDQLGGLFSQMLFCCETDHGRMFLNESANYKTVSSSLVIGAVANGDSLSLKPYIFAEMVNYFIEYDPYVSVNENLSNPFKSKNFPNPFTYNTTINYALKQTGLVKVEVYNTSGQMIRQLVNRELTSGEYSTNWDGTNCNGEPVKGGFYFYQINVGNDVQTDKIILLR